jgi:hypothetical protein
MLVCVAGWMAGWMDDGIWDGIGGGRMRRRGRIYSLRWEDESRWVREYWAD